MHIYINVHKFAHLCVVFAPESGRRRFRDETHIQGRQESASLLVAGMYYLQGRIVSLA